MYFLVISIHKKGIKIRKILQIMEKIKRKTIVLQEVADEEKEKRDEVKEKIQEILEKNGVDINRGADTTDIR